MMSTNRRLRKAFADAPRLPWSEASRYVMLSDCHRGNGSHNDQFLKNKNLFFAALTHYYKHDFTYLELGDGDELWVNRSPKQLIEVHMDTFMLIAKFYRENRFYSLYGNHDIIKRSPSYASSSYSGFYSGLRHKNVPLFPDIRFYEGLVLENQTGGRDLYLTHGHQADTLNSTYWRLARFLVRYFWGPLENLGVNDPTSAAKNNTKKDDVEKRLLNWAVAHKHLLVTGHTHRPALDAQSYLPYLNTGSCVHPSGITAIELVGTTFTLVKWTFCTRDDFTVYVCREVLSGPMEFPRQ